MIFRSTGCRWCSAGLLLVILVVSQSAMTQKLRDFSVTDEIGIARFGDPSGLSEGPLFSPSGKLVAVRTERGLVDQNRVEDELRIYDVDSLRRLANAPDPSVLPRPLVEVRKRTNATGMLISEMKWLEDSSGLAFLLKTEEGRQQLWLADVIRQTYKALTPAEHDVLSFHIRAASRFVYTVRSPGSSDAKLRESAKDFAFVATGQPLPKLLLDLMNGAQDFHGGDRSVLWAVHDGKPFLVRNSSDGKPVVLYHFGQDALSLSPDGNTVATALPVQEVPEAWARQYPQGVGILRIVPGPQDVGADSGSILTLQYAMIRLSSGRISVLTDAPTAASAGWVAIGQVAWSRDSRALLLPGTFLAGSMGAPPCVAVAVPGDRTVECVRVMEPMDTVLSVHFADGDAHRPVIDTVVFDSMDGRHNESREFAKTAGVWSPQQNEGGHQDSDVAIILRESLQDPPVLVVTDRASGRSRVVWDPNPQLKAIRLGEASVYRWKDKTGREWIGGLYKPPDYFPGRRYPLVIQTHGFFENEFRPSGQFPSAFAARALAAHGIIVLQVRDCPIRSTPDEGPCQVRGYQAAIEHLVNEGAIDPNRVGIIGFSRTVYYVMLALTTSTVHFRAASITDGINAGYLQYLYGVDHANNLGLTDSEQVIGASPTGSGLQTWFQRSPEFNVDNIEAALQVAAFSRLEILYMWEPYALMRVLKKPVDLLVINTYEHVLTNPEARLISQGGTVDWFRFWLKGEEDPDPLKAEQYKRWRGLRKLQKSNHATQMVH